jgi:hypothetical protein
MFYDEIDVQPAVDVATEMFGTVGNMSYGKNVLYNVTIATKEFGKIWYGDIDTIEMNPNVVAAALSQRIKQTVYMFVNQNTFDFNQVQKFSVLGQAQKFMAS